MWIVTAQYHEAKAGRPDSYCFKDEDLSALIRWMQRNRIPEKAHVTLKRVPA